MSIVTVREFHDELSGMEMLRENGRDKEYHVPEYVIYSKTPNEFYFVKGLTFERNKIHLDVAIDSRPPMHIKDLLKLVEDFMVGKHEMTWKDPIYCEGSIGMISSIKHTFLSRCTYNSANDNALEYLWVI